MKQILVLNYEFPPLGGGAGNATFYLFKEFTKNSELKIDLVTSSVDKFRIEQFSDNITIHFLDIGKKGNLHFQSNKDLLVYSWKAYWYSKKLKKKERFDLIHAFFGVPCGFIAMLLKIPYIVSLRGSDVPFYNKRFYWLDKLIFKRLSIKIWKNAKKVIANSRGLKDLALVSNKKQEIGIIYNGVNIGFFRPKEKDEKVFTIVSTSRLIERKGINHLIDAFINLEKENNNIKLIIAGDGDLKESLENKVKENNIDDKVEFWGKVKKEDVLIAYQESDVFVLPSLNEGMSNSLLEAMASGLAVITTDVGGTKELVDEDNGMIIEKEFSESIFESLKILLSNNELLNKMKRNSREKTEKMSWNIVANKYLEIY